MSTVYKYYAMGFLALNPQTNVAPPAPQGLKDDERAAYVDGVLDAFCGEVSTEKTVGVLALNGGLSVC